VRIHPAPVTDRRRDRRTGETSSCFGFRKASPDLLILLRSVAGVALIAVLAGPSFALRATEGTPEPIVLAMSAAFSGPSRGLGIEVYRGARAYFDDVDAHGGVNGRPIVIKAYDDGYNPAPAIYNTIRAIEQDRAFLLFSYVGTPTVTRVLPLLKRYRSRSMYLFFPFTGAQPQREPPYDGEVFNLRASYRDETYALVEQFARIGRAKIAILYQADAYGRSGWDGVRRALAARHATLAAEATYERGTPYTAHLTRQVEILRAAQPDAIIAIGAYAACAAFVRDVVDSGWKIPIANVSFVGSENMLNLLYPEEEKSRRDYTSMLVNSEVVPSYEDTTLPAVVEYRTMMQRHAPKPPDVADLKGYTPLGYNFAGFEGFLNAKVITEALRRLKGDFDPAKLKSAVESIREFDLGIDAPISFGSDRHQALQYVYFASVERGRWVPVVDWQRWAREESRAK
jgi:branched-chain amino acid transport system substrate-binding protein